MWTDQASDLISAVEQTEAEYQDLAGAGAEAAAVFIAWSHMTWEVAHSPTDLRVDIPGHCQVV